MRPRPTSALPRAEMFPSISLTGVFGVASRELGDLFKGDTAQRWTAAGSHSAAGRSRADGCGANVKRNGSCPRGAQGPVRAHRCSRAFREVLDALNGQRLIENVRTLEQRASVGVGACD